MPQSLNKRQELKEMSCSICAFRITIRGYCNKGEYDLRNVGEEQADWKELGCLSSGAV